MWQCYNLRHQHHRHICNIYNRLIVIFVINVTVIMIPVSYFALTFFTLYKKLVLQSLFLKNSNQQHVLFKSSLWMSVKETFFFFSFLDGFRLQRMLYSTSDNLIDCRHPSDLLLLVCVCVYPFIFLWNVIFSSQILPIVMLA